jgi:serine/threonine protein kinase
MSETRTSKGRLEIRQTVEGEAALLRLEGSMDETFSGFDPTEASQVVIELGKLSRITSYGVRQWIRGRDQLAAKQLYYVNCPPFFIDQLNMVLNFGGHGQVLTAFAPFSCPGCKHEKWALIDVLAKYDDLAAGRFPEQPCEKCQQRMEMDELPETYFGFVKAAGAKSLSREVAPLLSSAQLYAGGATAAAAPAASVRKLVHEHVTYFRIAGAIDRRFRARSLLEGTEGEVVVDLRELTAIADDGKEEWERLRTGLQKRASLLTLVDVPPPMLEAIDKGKLSLGGAVVYSILAPHKCEGCGRQTAETLPLGATGAAKKICSACGSQLRYVGKTEHMGLAARLTSGPILAGTHAMIERRDDLLSRAEVEAAAPDLPRKKGVILGKYEIARALSVGGMAEVFLAVQKGIGGFEKPVALKRIRRNVLDRRHQAVEQFLNEAKIAATLAHPNIAQIFDVGEEEGLLYLAMEYVHGKDLRVILRRLKDRNEKLPLGVALHIAQQIAGALHHAYTTQDLNGRQLKAIHRDVSPHNVLVAFDGTIKLIDFGVATSAATGVEAGQVAGKHNYMSPEQLQAQPLDARSDLFSLGVVLYELCTGERPFQQETREATLQAVNEAQFKMPSELRPDLPKSIDKLFQKLLAKKAADRFPDGQTLAEELKSFAQKNGVTIDNSWLRQTVPTLFPSSSSSEEAVPASAFTPRSDSFSLDPTNNQLTMYDTPSQKPGAGRGVGYTSGSLRVYDEQTLSQMVNPITKKSRFWMFLALILAVALLAALWWRY